MKKRKYEGKRKEYIDAYHARRRDEVRKQLDALLAQGCTRCSESDPSCLDFHHARGPKLFNIPEAVHRTYGRKKLQEELDKCVVLCANCHRKEHRRIAEAGLEPL